MFEETSDGEVMAGYHYRACGAQWADQPSAGEPPIIGKASDGMTVA